MTALVHLVPPCGVFVLLNNACDMSFASIMVNLFVFVLLFSLAVAANCASSRDLGDVG